MKLVVDNTGRELNEAEARAVATLGWLTMSKVRRTLARWAYDDVKVDDSLLLALGSQIRSCERAIESLVKGPPTDGHDLDNLIDRTAAEVDQLSEPLNQRA